MVTRPRMLTDVEEILELEAPDSTVVSFLNGFARLCLLGALIVAPWTFGGIETSVQFALYAAVLCALAAWVPAAICQAFTRGIKTNRLPLAIIPLFGFVCLGVCQLWPYDGIPSAESIQNAIESVAAESPDEDSRQLLAKKSLIQSLQTGRTVSQGTTRFEMARLTIVIATFFLATQLFVTPSAQLLLWSSFALNGAALAFFGICQQVSWNGKLFWSVTLRNGGQPFASFVNRNNAAGYLLICLAGALGLTLSVFARTYLTNPISVARVGNSRLRATKSRFSSLDLLSLINDASPAQLFAGMFVIVITTGVVLAMSRGGWLALACAVVLTGLFATRSRGWSILIFFAGIGVLCVGLVAWTGRGDQISKRWGQVASSDIINSDSRWAHWQDSMHAVADFPVTGTGFGTYQFAYLPYQTHPEISHKRFYNADNQFLEWLVEGGVVGLSLVCVSIFVIFAAILALLNRVPQDPVGLVGLFALVGECVSAGFDFGPTMPANMLALAAFFGAITGRAALLVNYRRMKGIGWGLSLPALRPSLLVPLFGIAVLVIGCMGLKEVRAAARTHAVSQNLPRLDSPESMEEAQVANLIQTLSAAISDYPDDPDAHLALAELWIYKFRLQEFQKATENRRRTPEAWIQTDPAFVFRQVNDWEKTGQIERIEMVIETPSIQENLAPAYEHLIKAQAACALIPDVSQLLATLEFVVKPERRSGEGFLRRALIVGPSSPTTFYQVGMLADFGELTDFSFACWRKSLKLSPRYLSEIHNSIAGRVPLDEEIEQILPNSGELLLQLAKLPFFNNTENDRTMLINRAISLLHQQSKGSSEAERRHHLGKAQVMIGDLDQAIQEYRRALDLSPYQIQWRVELTQILLDFKGARWALREAETCVALAPEQKRLHALVRDLQAKMAASEAPPSTNSKGRSK